MPNTVADATTPQISTSPSRRRRFRKVFIFVALAVLLVVPVYPRLLGNMISCAADHGNTGQVRFLLMIGANPDSFGWYVPVDRTPLMLAASDGSLSTVRVLLDHGADVNTGVNAWSSTPLMCAVEGGNPAVVRLLIARGAHLNDVDGGDDTPLTLAQTYHHPEIVQILKLAGAAKLPQR